MRIIPVIIILIGIICFAFIFDHRQDFIYENTENKNDYNYDTTLEIPNKAILPNKDIYNEFVVYDNIDGVVNEQAYKYLSDSILNTRIISGNNRTAIIELTANNEKGYLLGCFVIWSCLNNNDSKTVRISLLKENKSIIIFQETSTYKPFSNKFSESYTILDNITFTKEKILIEVFFEKYRIGCIEIREMYLLIISNDDLYPKVEFNELEVIFLFDIQLYYDNKKIIKFCLFIFSLIFYIHFYFRLNKKMKKFFNKNTILKLIIE